MILQGQFTLTELTIACSLISLILFSLLHFLKFDFHTKIIFSLAFICTFIQFATTRAGEHSPDFEGHIEYISHITYNLELPDPFGWQSQQPPLFYIVAAIFAKIGLAFGLSGFVLRPNWSSDVLLWGNDFHWAIAKKFCQIN